MKTIALFGLLTLLLMVANNKVGIAPSEAAQGSERRVAMPAADDIGTSDNVSPRLSEYLFLHQTRYENLPVHGMTDVRACSD